MTIRYKVYGNECVAWIYHSRLYPWQEEDGGRNIPWRRLFWASVSRVSWDTPLGTTILPEADGYLCYQLLIITITLQSHDCSKAISTDIWVHCHLKIKIKKRIAQGRFFTDCYCLDFDCHSCVRFFKFFCRLIDFLCCLLSLTCKYLWNRPFLPCGFGKTAAARSRNIFMASVQNRLSHRRCEVTATSLRFSNFCPTFFLKKR